MLDQCPYRGYIVVVLYSIALLLGCSANGDKVSKRKNNSPDTNSSNQESDANQTKEELPTSPEADDNVVDTTDGAPKEETSINIGDDTTDPMEDSTIDPSAMPEITSANCPNINGLLLCEDFESGKIDESKWKVFTKNSLEGGVKDQNAHSGNHALHIKLDHSLGKKLDYFIMPKNIFPVEGNKFFGRAFLYINQSYPSGHSYFLSAESTIDGALAQERLDCNGSKLNTRWIHKSIEEHGGIMLPTSKEDGYVVSADKWNCLEWEYDGETSVHKIWINGEEIKKLEGGQHIDDRWQSSQYTDFKIGAHIYHVGEDRDMYWDDIVLAKYKIGCGGPQGE